MRERRRRPTAARRRAAGGACAGAAPPVASRAGSGGGEPARGGSGGGTAGHRRRLRGDLGAVRGDGGGPCPSAASSLQLDHLRALHRVEEAIGLGAGQQRPAPARWRPSCGRRPAASAAAPPRRARRPAARRAGRSRGVHVELVDALKHPRQPLLVVGAACTPSWISWRGGHARASPAPAGSATFGLSWYSPLVPAEAVVELGPAAAAGSAYCRLCGLMQPISISTVPCMRPDGLHRLSDSSHSASEIIFSLHHHPPQALDEQVATSPTAARPRGNRRSSSPSRGAAAARPRPCHR